jgi:hypothetical protein
MGGVTEVVGLVMMCAAIAAFMSTADSLVIALSTILAVDVYQHLFWRNFKWGDEDGTVMVGSSPVTLGRQAVVLSKVTSALILWMAVNSALAPACVSDPMGCLGQQLTLNIGLQSWAGPAALFACTNMFGCGERVTAPAITIGILIGALTWFVLMAKLVGAVKACDPDQTPPGDPESVDCTGYPETYFTYSTFSAIVNLAEGAEVDFFHAPIYFHK